MHFNERSVEADSEYALQALTSLSIIVARQFGAFGNLPWFIPNTPGSTYIAQAWESNPFVNFFFATQLCIARLQASGTGDRSRYFALAPR